MGRYIPVLIGIFAVVVRIDSCPVVNCGTTSPVSEGQPSRIMCYFVHDLRLVKTDFSIYHYAEPSSAEMPGMVLDCYYRDKDSTDPVCETADGYIFNGEYGTTVTLDIPQTSKSNDGNYVCQTTSAGLQKNRVCALHVKSKDDEVDEESTTTCRTNTPVTEGDPSFIECSFTHDPQENQHYFNIMRYDVDEMNSVPEVVLDCVWHVADREPECHVHKGYEFNGITGNKVNLTIPRTTLHHAGKYQCEDSPTLPSKMMCCSHEVKPALTSTQRSVPSGLDTPRCVVSEHVALGEPAAVTCLFPSDLDVSSKFVNVEHRDIMKDGTVSPLKDQILHCAPKLSCQADRGYELRGAGESNLTIAIPVLQHHQLGKYACTFFEGNEEIQSQECFLSLSKGNVNSSENKDKINPWMIAVCAMLTILIVCLFIFFCYKQRKCISRVFKRNKYVHTAMSNSDSADQARRAGEHVLLTGQNGVERADRNNLEAQQNGNVSNGDVHIVVT